MPTSALLSLFLVLPPQTAPDTLAEYLRAAKTPRTLVVAPETVRRTKPGAGLAAYGRKAVELGAVRAVVPTRIATFDDAFAQPPNLYDGLPREAKLLYLLTTLTPAQRALASRRGVGLADLQGEQRAVFASLLPKRLGWRKSRIAERLQDSEAVGEGIVEGKALEGVRVQVVRTLYLSVPLGDRGSRTGLYTNMDNGAPGEVVASRTIDEDEERQGDGMYGVQLRKEADNKPKPGALDTRRLDAPVALPKGATVGTALAAAGRAIGREILADRRVRDLAVSWNGAAVRAGDLLDALALAVGGTYRKVDGTFLLTSDVIGLGARQIRVKAWEQSVAAAVARRQDEWRRLLTRQGANRSFAYASDDKLAPTPEIDAAIDAPADPKDPYPIRDALLTPALRGFLQRQQTMYKSQDLRIDGVGAMRSTTYRFVLPDGTPLRGESMGLGFDFQFQDQPPRPVRPPVREAPAAKLPADGPAVPAIFRTDVPAEAARAVETAKAHGLREVWLETSRAEALAEALKGGLPVRLVARPWAAAAGDPPDAIDRTPLGDDGAALARRFATDPLFVDRQGAPFVSPRPTATVLAPGSGPARRATLRIAALARSPGLAGVVLLGTTPHGYEGQRTRGMYGDYPAQMVAAGSFGYGEALRLAFLREKGVDPIDLGWELTRSPVDLRPDFFPDDNLRNYLQGDADRPTPPGFDGLLAQWDAFRQAANEAAVRTLLAALPRLPVEIEARAQPINAPGMGRPIVAPVPPDGALPNLPEGYPTGDPMEREIVPVASAAGAAFRMARPEFVGAPPAIDLTAVAPADWAAALDRAFGKLG